MRAAGFADQAGASGAASRPLPKAARSAISFLFFIVRQVLARVCAASIGPARLLLAALAIAAVNPGPARAQGSDWKLTLPDYLFEKARTGSPKLPKLRGPKCPACQKEWQALKDALISWYLLQYFDAQTNYNAEASKSADERDQDKVGQFKGQMDSANDSLASVGIPTSGTVRSSAVDGYKKRKDDDPDYGNQQKLMGKIQDLISILEKCYAHLCLPKPAAEIPEVPPCVDTQAQKDALVRQLKALAEKLDDALNNLMKNKKFSLLSIDLGNPRYASDGSMDPELLQAKANFLAAARALRKAKELNCSKEKTGESDENAKETPPKEAPPKETPPPNATPPPKEQRSMLPGPPGSGSGVDYAPGLMRTVAIATERMQWCTFGSARAVATVLTPTDASGNLIASVMPPDPAATAEATPGAAERVPSTRSTPPTDTPEQPGTSEQTPATPMTPLATPGKRSPSVRDRPPETPPAGDRPPGDMPSVSTPGQPKTTDRTPAPTEHPATPTANMPPAPKTVTVDFNDKAYAKEVAENAEKAKAEPSAAVKLEPLAPDLPRSGEKSAQDQGFDKDPATGRMGSDGHVGITTGEPQAYGLASGPGAPTHYRADIDTPEHGGFVAETTGKPVEPAQLASVLPAGVKAALDTFKLGGRIYTRVGLDRPRTEQLDAAASAAAISKAIDARLETDTCRRTKPAPAPGLEPASLGATGNAVPGAVIKLGRLVPGKGS